MNRKAKVCCLIVTYNGAKWIENCLNSLADDFHELNITCVDNGSSDATISIISEKFPKVHIIKTCKNLGFGQANNLGFTLALAQNAEYVFLLNQDAMLEPNVISALIAVHEKDPSFGILSPVHLNGAGDKLDKYFFKYFTESDISSFTYSTLTNKNNIEPVIKTCFVNAAAWLISNDCLKKVGGFDPIFFHYGEDRNYIQRTLFHGFNAGICPGINIFHDREERLNSSKESIHSKIKTDWIHFLSVACNINIAWYKKFILKELTKHTAKSVSSLLILKKRSFLYHANMVLKITTSIHKIVRSRRESICTNSVAHL